MFDTEQITALQEAAQAKDAVAAGAAFIDLYLYGEHSHYDRIKMGGFAFLISAHDWKGLTKMTSSTLQEVTGIERARAAAKTRKTAKRKPAKKKAAA